MSQSEPTDLLQIMPALPLDDVRAGVRYYRDVLGFSVNHAQDDIAVMDRGRARILLVRRERPEQGNRIMFGQPFE
jgi:catechol-2,3-dioxygenase